MGKRSIKKADVVITINGRGLTQADLENLLAKRVSRGPGFYDDGGDEYCHAKFTRILQDESTVVYSIKADGYIDCQMNLRFHKGRPIPGFGGDSKRWSAYAAYWRGADFPADMKRVVAVSDAVKAKAKA